MERRNQIRKTFDRLNSDPSSVDELRLALYALNSINECITITDGNGKIIFVNDAFLKTYGYKLTELVGKTISIVHSDKNEKSLVDQIRPATNNEGWTGRLWNTKKDGTEFLIELYTSVAYDDNGNSVAHVGVARDLTQQLENESLLHDTQDKFRNLFRDLKDAVYETTPEGKFIDMNPAGLELLGVKSLEELKGINARSFYVNESDRQENNKILESKGFLKDHEINIRKITGEVVTVIETAIAVRNSSGKIIAYRGILRDITEQKKNEGKLKQLIDRYEYVNNQLKQSELELKNTNATKDKFFSIIAHDLRSPFNSLLNFSEFLVQDIDELSKEDIKSFADKIHEASKNVYDLLENLLQWSRIQSGKIPYQPSTVNVSFKINQVINLLRNNAEAKGIKLINETSPTSIIFADEDMIFSVLQNLLSNAIKFTHNGGSVRFKSLIKASAVDISISDTGVGIKEENLKKLFRLEEHLTTYGTKDEKGSGLGLILCKEMIDRNRGKIDVVSKVGEGTTITISLPKA